MNVMGGEYKRMTTGGRRSEIEELLRAFKVLRGDDRKRVAWRIVRTVAMYPCRGSFWGCLKARTGIREDRIKEVMLYLEEIGELKILRSIDGRRLYVSTLRGVRRAPVKLDEWLVQG